MDKIVKIVNRDTGVATNFKFDDYHFSMYEGRISISRHEFSSTINTQKPLSESGYLPVNFNSINRTQDVKSIISTAGIGDVVELSRSAEDFKFCRMVLSKHSKKTGLKFITRVSGDVLYAKRTD